MPNIISLVISAFGLFGLFGLRQNYRARLRQFEEKYIQRYWSILDDLSLKALSLSHTHPCESDERAIRKYILLCEDELQMRKNGYISDVTYKEWAEGICDQLAQPMFKEVWKKVERKVKEERISKEGEGEFPYTYLTGLMAAENCKPRKSYDPLDKPRLVRAIRGLKGIGGV